MDHPTFHCRLDLPENPLQRGFVLPRATAGNHYRIFRPAEILNRPTLRQLQVIHLTVGTVAVFYKPAGAHGIIHTDVALHEERWRKNVAAINWNLSGTDSVMRWYEIDAPGVEPDLAAARQEANWYRALNGIHFGFFGARGRKNLSQRKVRVLESAFVGSATLVRTEIPHAVENTDARKGRWALSLRFEPDFENWQDALTALTPLFKNPLPRRRDGAKTERSVRR